VAFKNDGAIDPAGTDAIIDFYLASGVHGFFPLGTHGQGMVMEIDERKKVAEQIVNRVRGRVPVVMHIGTANTYSSIDLAKHAASLGVDAIGVVPPYYYPHDDYEVYAHYKPSPTPFWRALFIYDNTETTHVEITPPKANKIIEASLPTLAGIKVRSSLMTSSWVRVSVAQIRRRFSRWHLLSLHRLLHRRSRRHSPAIDSVS
jgi:dihydrodipicolinate synthase/N-acetylneuraminate lyase